MPSRRALAWIAATCLAALFALAWVRVSGQPLSIDRAAFDALHAQAHPGWRPWVQALHALGYRAGVLPVDAVLVIALLLRGRRRLAAFAAVALGGGLLLNAGLKIALGIDRPAALDPWVTEATLGFPSGHAQATASLACVGLILAWPTAARMPLALVACVALLAVGASRILAGVHVPTDVLGGWLLGAGWAAAVASVIACGAGPAQGPGRA